MLPHSYRFWNQSSTVYKEWLRSTGPGRALYNFVSSLNQANKLRSRVTGGARGGLGGVGEDDYYNDPDNNNDYDDDFGNDFDEPVSGINNIV